ncbi:uncharacterized protein LOC132725293 [Ruditapes philippinarum]|jgi:hypothetical protein|uniref:uncharacterized protein LOC132725293 n=1 Tax=Ruditapes philippinarum TaxID=129788 RepID=UPI00295AB7A4|nr:uncharacterized protein LOC132725293 [Ruditapes philippinarum]
MRDFTVTEQQAQNLEVMTRGQHESPAWHRQRQGRITASFVHDVKTLKSDTSRKSIVNKILKIDQKNLSKIEAVKFGIKNEKVAKEQYKTQMMNVHNNFTLRDSGLVVDTTCPFFAATPDGVRECSCHGSGLVEVKCVYKHKDQEISNIDDNTFYLEKDDLSLKKGHRYFTQVQFQMYVCSKTFCDFVVFTEKGIHIQTINYDSDFVQELIEKCDSFVKNDLLVEIIQRKLL